MSQKKRRILPIVMFALGLLGTALLIVLVLRHGAGDVMRALGAAGWRLPVAIAFYLVPLFLDAVAWRQLFPRDKRLPLLTLWRFRWIGDSINALLPASQVGGDIVRARLAALKGTPVALAAATVVVGITLNVVTQTIFTLTGLALLAWYTGQRRIILPALGATVVAMVAIGAFYALQRRGIFKPVLQLISKLTSSSDWRELVKHGENLDGQVRALYARKRAIIISGAWSMLSWSVGAVEVWIALWALGQHASLARAWVLESLGQGIRAVLFLVPGALGFQEATYIGVGSLLGIPSTTGLALSLVRRARELTYGVPGLVAWQVVEGKRLWHGGRRHQKSDEVVASQAAP